MDHTNNTLSLVICTRNRATQLQTCLNALKKISTQQAWQLIVVDNGSTDNTKDVVSAFIQDFSITAHYVFEPQAGLSAARNAGWKAANTRYIAFIDDDCYPSENYIDMLLTAFHANPNAGFIGGRVLLFDPTDLPITIQTHAEKIEFSPRSTIMAGTIHGANFAFTQAALNAAKGFDVLFGAGKKYPCEDVDTMAEILRLGWAGIYEPSIVVYHHHMRKLQSDADKLMASYDIGRGAFFAKRIFRPGSIFLYATTWLRRTRWQSFDVTKRELQGAFGYMKDATKYFFQK